MKKSILFSFFALLLTTFGFGGVSMADTIVDTINVLSTITSVPQQGNLPILNGSNLSVTGTGITTMDGGGSNRSWYKWSNNSNSWSAIGVGSTEAVVTDGTHYGLGMKVTLEGNTTSFATNPTILFNGEPWTSGHTQWKYNDSNVVIIDLGEAPTPANYNLWVGNTQVTSENKDDVLGDGKVTFNPTTNTLNFNNATIENYYTRTDDNNAKCNIFAKDIDLIITGKVNFPSTEVRNSIAILSSSTPNISATINADITFSREIWVYGNLTIAGGSLTRTINGSAIYANGTLTIGSGISKIDVMSYIGGYEGITIEDPLVITSPEGLTITNGVTTSIGSLSEYSTTRIVIEPVTEITNITISGITDPVLGETATTGSISIEPTEGIELDTSSGWGPSWRAYAKDYDSSNIDCSLSSSNSYTRCSPTFTKEDDHSDKFYYLRLIFTPKAGYSLANNYTVTFNGSGTLWTTYHDTSHDFYVVKIKYPVSEIQGPTTSILTGLYFTGIILPVDGANPIVAGISTTSPLTLGDITRHERSGYDIGPALSESATFSGGNTYAIKIKFTVNEGYRLPLNTDGNDFPYRAFRNGIEDDMIGRGWDGSQYTQEGGYYYIMFNKLIATSAPTPTTYTITWKNGNDTLKEDTVNAGETPAYSGDTPTKGEDSSCTYTFDKWTPDIVAASDDATYTATFTCTAKQSSSSSSSSSSGGGGGGKTVKKDTTNTETDKDTEKENTDKDVPLATENKPENPTNPSEVLDNGFTREQNDAYKFAFENGITTMDNIEKADMEGGLTRIAMAKMLSQYAINILKKTPDTNKTCKFSDVSEQLDADYNHGVTLACQLGIMGVGITEFRPNDEVTRAEFGTALSRMLYGTADGDGAYYKPHLEILKQLGIITNDNPELKELRGYVMIMLMRSAN